MRKWFRNWIGSPESPPQAHILFVDGENSPPAPDLMMEAVLSHAGCELDLAFAWAKWYPTMLLLRGLREVGVECIQADEGSNNADIMLSLRAQKEVSERAMLGQGGVAYVAFGTDKGFSHLLKAIKTTKGWKSVYVTSYEDPPSILVRSASEVLYVHKSPPPKKTPPAKKPVKSPPPKKGRRRPKKEAKPKTSDWSELETPDWSELDTSNKDDLEKLLISLIRRDNLNAANLGKRISAYQKNNGLQDTGSKALLQEFGFKRYLSLNKVITREFSEKISVEVTAFRTDPETEKNHPSSFEYSVKRTEDILTAQSLEEATVWSPPKKKFENFEDMILELIGKEKIDTNTLSWRIIAYQKTHDWEETGKKAINQEFGFPPGRSYNLSIEELLSERVEVSGVVPRYYYQVKNELSLEEE